MTLVCMLLDRFPLNKWFCVIPPGGVKFAAAWKAK